MSFLNLPTDWSESPLSDPTLAADVVDLCVSAGDRRLGLFKVIFCDEANHFRGGVDISLRDRHGQLRLTDCRSVLEPVVLALRDSPDLGVLLALGRPGPDAWEAVDSHWAETTTAVCEEAGVRLLAFYVATSDRVRRIEARVNA